MLGRFGYGNETREATATANGGRVVLTLNTTSTAIAGATTATFLSYATKTTVVPI